ncbi:MAG: ABC transporter ATP-binding protein, partial [Lachnospiraceae bacterium]|nr:ABC transporter ATP-binding protein [Lachnospiraceae bacterium]
RRTHRRNRLWIRHLCASMRRCCWRCRRERSSERPAASGSMTGSGWTVSQWIMNICNNRIVYRVVKDIRNDAFEKIEKLPISYIDAHPFGDTMSRVISDTDTFADGLLMGFTQMFTGVVTIFGTIIFMLTINVWITLIVVCITPLSLFVARFVAKHTYDMFKKQSEIKGKETAFINEMIAGQKVVTAFGHEDENMEEFDEMNEKLRKCSLRATFFSSTVNPSTRFVNNIVYAGVGVSGAIMAILKPSIFTVGNLTAFLSYASQYTKPFNEISGVVTEMQNAIACADRIFELIEETPQPEDVENAVVLEDVTGNVELKNVEFSYVAKQRLIEDFNLQVKPGMKVAIVGPTGCGKSTIINLLMRFYDTNSGEICVDGNNIKKVQRKSLRKSYGMVLQETWFKEGTIRDNITMGEEVDEEEVIKAAKMSHADSFIRRLPNGYDTYISEDGGNLSNGQKQLLCITRIMLNIPSMLILDEATSSIDTRTELRIQDAFNKMMEGRTSFIVAHRLSTIKNADIIIAMKDGHIIEQGNHKELLEKGGFYANLYNSQFAHS